MILKARASGRSWDWVSSTLGRWVGTRLHGINDVAETRQEPSVLSVGQHGGVAWWLSHDPPPSPPLHTPHPPGGEGALNLSDIVVTVWRTLLSSVASWFGALQQGCSRARENRSASSQLARVGPEIKQARK